MRRTRLILYKDLKANLASPVSWVAIMIFALCNAFVYQVYYFKIMELSRRPDALLDGPFLLTRSYLGFVGSLILFIIPLLTMSTYSEEKRQGTHELLFSLPLNTARIVLGKFLAGLCLVLVLLLLSALLLTTVFFTSSPAVPPMITAFFGLFLFAAAILSIGQAVSGMTDNPIVAASSTFILVLFLFLFSRYSSGSTLGIGGVLAFLSPLHHLDDFLNGVLDLSHTVFFLSLVALGLFTTHQVVEGARNRG